MMNRVRYVSCVSKLLTSLRQVFGVEVWKRRGRESENAMGYSLDVVMRTRSV